MSLLQDNIKDKIKSMKCMQDLLVIYRLHKNTEYQKWRSKSRQMSLCD